MSIREGGLHVFINATRDPVAYTWARNAIGSQNTNFVTLSRMPGYRDATLDYGVLFPYTKTI